MKHSNLYYRDIYLGTLYENGRFDYMVNSNQADYMNVETIVHILEVIRESCLDKEFNFDKYIREWNNFYFQDDFEFK